MAEIEEVSQAIKVKEKIGQDQVQAALVARLEVVQVAQALVEVRAQVRIRPDHDLEIRRKVS